MKEQHTASCLEQGITEKDNSILEKEEIAQSIYSFVFKAPLITAQCKAGQFVIVRVDEHAERIPLTIADFDRERGLLTMVVQTVGASTRKMARLQKGDLVADIVGPLGLPSHIEKFGTVVCVGGGVGVAPVFPIARELHGAGNRVISILGSRDKGTLIWEEKMRGVSDELLVTTNDGSYGRKGFVTDALRDVIAKEGKIDLIVAIGPVIMMKSVAEVAAQHGIKTTVSLNSIMVDGTGMCGGCRIKYGNEVKFVCVDGPEFDASLVDFTGLMSRQAMYRKEEQRGVERDDLEVRKLEELKKKNKTRTPMPEQDPKIRAKNFQEVTLGYTADQALREASRCLNCKNKPCVEGCPVNVQIPEFIKLITERNFIGAVQKIKETNALPAICGRVCPQETQCEERCILAKKGEAVAIGRLERFVADFEYAQGNVRPPVLPAPSGHKVAIIGGGPAGMTAAADLSQLGHEVHIFEALHKAGGVLTYGIPEFRLPKAIVQREIDYLEKLNVKIHPSYVIGRTLRIDQMMREMGFDALFIGTGAGLPNFLNIPGENANGVYSSNEFLTRINLMKAYMFPEYETPVRVGQRVAVIGGGNVAMDSARSALRLGAEKVSLIYRRSMEELPARAEEVHHAQEEGIDFMLLNNPERIIEDENGWVKGIELLRMELGEPDSSGRRRPVPVKGSEHIVDIDLVVVAIGQGPNPLLLSTMPDLKLNKWGNIVADEETGLTSMPGVFAGGDIVTGAATVISAMGAGKKAAVAMHQYLMGK